MGISKDEYENAIKRGDEHFDQLEREREEHEKEIEKKDLIISKLKKSNEFYANGNGLDDDDSEYMEADDSFPWAGEQLGKLAREIKKQVEELENE